MMNHLTKLAAGLIAICAVSGCAHIAATKATPTPTTITTVFVRITIPSPLEK